MTDLRETVAAKRAEIDKAPTPATRTAFDSVRSNENVLRIIGLDPRDPKSHAVVAVCDRYGLDPVLGHIMILGSSRLPYVTRDGFLHIAHRSGQLDGIEVNDPHREGAAWVTHASVWRKDMTRPFTYPGAADVGRDNAPEMAIARAERRALKRAFAVTLPREFAEDEYDTRAAPPVDPPRPAGPAGSVPYHEPERYPDTEDRPIEDTPSLPYEGDPFAGPIDEKGRRAVMAAFRRAEISDRTERLALISQWCGRDVGSVTELTIGEGAEVLSRIGEMRSDRDVGEGSEADERSAADDDR